VTTVLVVIVVAALLAWANGANDISKGIATLVGSGVSGYSRATFWGTMWTGLGAAVATLATGAAVSAYGIGGVAWASIVSRVALPLAATPILALALGSALSRVLRLTTVAGLPPVADCLCLTATTVPVAAPMAFVDGTRSAPVGPWVPSVSATTGEAADCAAAQPGALQLTVDHLHWLSSGAVSFARGLNDAPKIAALGLSALALAPTVVPTVPLVFAVVGVAMVVGSVVGGRRVTRLLAEKVTPMSHHEGLVANVVTAVLVTTGALSGLPMSTTHVSSGAIVGIGAARRSVLWSTVRTMVLAWIATLPAAAAIGAALQVILAAAMR
jgi:PiT family inorganic phosphate transporter